MMFRPKYKIAKYASNLSEYKILRRKYANLKRKVKTWIRTKEEFITRTKSPSIPFDIADFEDVEQIVNQRRQRSRARQVIFDRLIDKVAALGEKVAKLEHNIWRSGDSERNLGYKVTRLGERIITLLNSLNRHKSSLKD